LHYGPLIETNNLYAPTPNGQSPSASLNKSNTPGIASLLLKMPPKNVCKRKTKTSTSTDNVERSDREAGESGHERDEGERDAQEEGDREQTSCSFSTETEERLVEFVLQQTQRFTTRHSQLSINGSLYIHAYIYRNKRTLALRTCTYNVRARKNTVRENAC